MDVLLRESIETGEKKEKNRNETQKNLTEMLSTLIFVSIYR